MGVVNNEIRIAGKVDKVEGKGLSENDFTDADLAKLNKSEPKYVAGDVVDLVGAMGYGHVTSSKKSLNLFLPLSKEISGTPSINITNISVRGDNEYVLNGANIMDTAAYTLGNIHTRCNGIEIPVTKKDDSAFNVVNNNSPVVFYITTGTLTIS